MLICVLFLIIQDWHAFHTSYRNPVLFLHKAEDQGVIEQQHRLLEQRSHRLDRAVTAGRLVFRHAWQGNDNVGHLSNRRFRRDRDRSHFSSKMFSFFCNSHKGFRFSRSGSDDQQITRFEIGCYRFSHDIGIDSHMHHPHGEGFSHEAGSACACDEYFLGSCNLIHELLCF